MSGRGARTLALLAALLPAACGGASEPPPPSVILVSIDALRRDHLGLYGYGRDVTPGLDRLAEESLVFDRAYAVASWTLISHMSMLTGLHPRQHGVVDGDRALAEELPLLTERLQRAGYHTLGLHAGGWMSPRFGFARGFDAYPQHDLAPRMEANLAAALWRGDVPATEPQREALVALYDASIRYADDVLARWVDAWRADGLLDESVLVVTSDHGESLWQRGRTRQDHGGMREEGLQVPLLVRFPDGRFAGERRAGDGRPPVAGEARLDRGRLGRALLRPRGGPGGAGADPRGRRPRTLGGAARPLARVSAERAASPDPPTDRVLDARSATEAELQMLRDLGYLGDE